MKRKVIFFAVKWGGISAVVLALLELVKYYARLIDYPFQTVSVLFFIFVMIGLLYLCIKEVRDKVYGGQISFARAFSNGALMMLVAVLLLFPYLCIQYTYIDKNAVAEMNSRNWENYRNLQAKDTLTAEEFTTFFEHVEAVKNASKNTRHGAVESSSADPQSLESIVDSLLNELLPVTKQKLQGIDSVKLGNFVTIAQKEWMNTAAVMLNDVAQWENAELSALSLRVAVQTLRDSMPHFAPIDRRMESLKDKVPHHKTPTAAALSYAIFSVLLYGLFFTIFVALYLYRKKKT
jgi:hypothetical protein